MLRQFYLPYNRFLSELLDDEKVELGNMINSLGMFIYLLYDVMLLSVESRIKLPLVVLGFILLKITVCHLFKRLRESNIKERIIL